MVASKLLVGFLLLFATYTAILAEQLMIECSASKLCFLCSCGVAAFNAAAWNPR